MNKKLYFFLSTVIYFFLISCRSLPEYREDFSHLVSEDTKLLLNININENKNLVESFLEDKFNGSVNISKILKRTESLSFYLNENNTDYALLLKGNYNRFYSGTYLTVSSKWKKESSNIKYWKNEELNLNLYGFKDKAILLTNQDVSSVLTPSSLIEMPEDYNLLKNNNIFVFYPDFSSDDLTNEAVRSINFPANRLWLLFNKYDEKDYNLVIRGEFDNNKDARHSSSAIKLALKKFDKENLPGIKIDNRIKSDIDGNRLYLEGFYIEEEALIDLFLLGEDQ